MRKRRFSVRLLLLLPILVGPAAYLWANYRQGQQNLGRTQAAITGADGEQCIATFGIELRSSWSPILERRLIRNRDSVDHAIEQAMREELTGRVDSHSLAKFKQAIRNSLNELLGSAIVDDVVVYYFTIEAKNDAH